MNPIYCSTGAFITRRNNRDYTMIPSQAALLGWKEFELMLFQDWYPKIDALCDFLLDSGLSFPAVHAEKNITALLAGTDEEQAEAERLFRQNCRVARKLGAFIVLHLWHGTHPKETIDRLLTGGIRRIREIAADTGVEVTIENTPSVSGSVTGFLERILAAHPDQRFTIDMRHTTFQREDDALLAHPYLWKTVRHIHISDYSGPPYEFSSLSSFCLPQEGNVRFDKWFSFLAQLPFMGSYTMESNSAGPNGIEDVDALTAWLRFIQRRASGDLAYSSLGMI